MQTKQLTNLFYGIGFTKGMYLHLPLMTLFLLQQGVTASFIVLAGLFYSLGQFLFEVPTGYLADRYGQKRSMIAGFIVEGVGLFAIVVSPTVWGLVASYFLGGIAGAFLSGSEEALCYENTVEAKTNHIEIYGRFLSANTIGMVVASLFGGLAFSFYGLSAAPYLFISTGVALFVAALMTTFLREAKTTKLTKQHGSQYLTVVKEGFAFVAKEDLLRTTLIISMLIMSGEWVLYNVYQPVFEISKVPAIWFGLVLSIGMMVNALVTANVYRLEKYWKLETILVSVTGLTAVAYLLFALVPHPVVAVVTVAVILGFAEAYRPVLSDYLNERIPSDKRVTILSTISLAQRFSAMLMRLVLTAAVLLGGFVASVLAQGVYLVIGSVLAWWLLKRCGCTHRIKSRSPILIEEVRT
ncbi:MAG: MFS transporter [Parcubacteria group bacterium]|nr:MFS transporter [Parcubacteria group bacterium]